MGAVEVDGSEVTDVNPGWEKGSKGLCSSTFYVFCLHYALWFKNGCDRPLVSGVENDDVNAGPGVGEKC